MNNTLKQANSIDISKQFIQFAIDNQVLSFGKFKTKAGRLSPYFFNAGKFTTGKSLWTLANFYAQHIIKNKLDFDVLFGPAYKGITLASSIACAMSTINSDVDTPFAFNRKEIKDHGEGGVLVGANLNGKRVLIIDDVISAGTSILESIKLIQDNGGIVSGVVIALDRMEKGGDAMNITQYSAVQELKLKHNINISSIANLQDLFTFISDVSDNNSQYKDTIQQYISTYGSV
jgi:orotate phosphoribosyltransferase